MIFVYNMKTFRQTATLHAASHNMNSPEIKEFIKENRHLFWWIKPEERENVDLSFLVETILNYGNEKSVKKLFDLIGIQTVAEIFYRQTSRQRINYHPRTVHYFTLYFQRHAQTHPDTTTN